MALGDKEQALRIELGYETDSTAGGVSLPKDQMDKDGEDLGNPASDHTEELFVTPEESLSPSWQLQEFIRPYYPSVAAHTLNYNLPLKNILLPDDLIARLTLGDRLALNTETKSLNFQFFSEREANENALDLEQQARDTEDYDKFVELCIEVRSYRLNQQAHRLNSRHAKSALTIQKTTPTVEETMPIKKGKTKRQMVPRKATIDLDKDATTKALTENEIIKVAQQPPAFRKKYSRYFNRDGKIKEAFFQVIFRRGIDNKLVVPEIYLASNVENWKIRLRQFEHPEYYNWRGLPRGKEVKVRKDQRDPTGRFIKNEVDVLNSSKKRMAISNAVLGQPALGINPIREPAVKPELQRQLDEAMESQLHLRAEMDEQDRVHRREIFQLKKEHQKDVKAFLKQIDTLTERVSQLETENKELREQVDRDKRVIDLLSRRN